MAKDAATQQLFVEALGHPFFDDPDPGPPANRWLTWLSEHCPLWTFQTDKFLRHQESDLPSTDPLESFINSVLADEGWDLQREPFDPPEHHRLVENVYARRDELAAGKPGVFFSAFTLRRDDGSLRWETRPPSRLLGRAEVPRDIEYSPFEDIGRELVGRIRALKAVKDSDERETAQANLDAFLDELGTNLPAHHPGLDPPKEFLKEIFTQGRALLDVLWMPLGPELPAETREILAELGANENNLRDWALRLAVPALSWPELQAVGSQFLEASEWSKLGPKPTARRLTVWMLARRLGSVPERIANKVGAGSDWDYFKSGSNPVDSFVEGP